MKVLLDECVPWPMHRFLTGHDCQTAQKCGWGGLKNGALLLKAEVQFDAFITADQNIRYQQNLQGRRLPIIELSTNDLRRILAAADQIRAALSILKPGDYVRLDIP